VIVKKNIPKHFVGHFTTENRTVWAKYRQKLLELDPINERNFIDLNECMILCALDSRSPRDDDEAGYLTAADPSNRYWDNITQLIVFNNGKVGCVGEHSPTDAPYIAWTLDHVCEQIMSNKIDRAPENYELKRPEKMVWKLDDEIKSGIEEAEIHYRPLKDDLDLKTFNFKYYGKNWMKDNQLSPDSLIQMAIQLAYRRLHNRVGCAIYETSHLRKFYHGRTETLRSFFPIV